MIGLIIICVLIASFFILVITLLCKSYTKDIIELEERLLQLEKRINSTNKELKGQVEKFDFSIENIWTVLENEVTSKNRKEGDSEVACKKGRGGRKK